MTSVLDGRTILFVHPSDELYGADRCLLELVRGLPPLTRAIVVLPLDVGYAGALSRQLLEAGADIRQVDFAVVRRGALRPGRWPGLVRRLVVGSWQVARLARESGAEIVHTNTLAPLSGPIAALLARRRHVWHVHEVISDEHWAVRLVYRLFLVLLPGSVIANSKATARSLAGQLRFVSGRTTVVYPGLGECRGSASRPARDAGDVLRIGFVGRLTPRKGIGELLEAVSLLHSRGIAVELAILGSAPPGQEWREGQYRRRADGLGLGDIVRFAGFVENARLRLGRVDVLVVPSQRPEPFGLVVLEGMAAGCAVVVSRNGGGSDEIIEHGVTGLYCGRTAASIAAAIERLARDPALRDQFGRRAQVTVWERFALEQYLGGILKVYRDELG